MPVMNEKKNTSAEKYLESLKWWQCPIFSGQLFLTLSYVPFKFQLSISTFYFFIALSPFLASSLLIILFLVKHHMDFSPGDKEATQLQTTGFADCV